MLCIVETQLQKGRVEGLARTLGFDRSFAVNSLGRKGGIVIFWKNEIKIVILPYSQYHLDAIVSSVDMQPWRLTCVYGEARTNERYKTWDMLKFVKSTSALPWLCIRDFNEVLHRSEHDGVNQRSVGQITAFRDTIDVCGLQDLGFRGLPWTFKKKVAGGSYYRTRLDRALATTRWSARYPLAELHHLSAASSDHSPIILLFDGEKVQKQRRERIFRYEAMWESHESFDPFLKQVWTEGGTSTTTNGVRKKLTSLSQNLASWNKNSFGNVRRKLKQLRLQLE
jgi:hypothetical protein